METKLIDLWYCKALKESGKPIMIRTFKNGKAEIRNTNKWQHKVYDKQGNELLIRMAFNNTTGKPKASGARSMLEIIKID